MNSAEEAAAAVQAALYPDGRPLRFVNMRHTWENCTDPLNFCSPAESTEAERRAGSTASSTNAARGGCSRSQLSTPRVRTGTFCRRNRMSTMLGCSADPPG
jgi:hypothetical protein